MDEKQTHVIKYPESYSLCLGCASCEIACALSHEGSTGPCKTHIKLVLDDFTQLHNDILVCAQCADHPCYEACPKKDKAMRIDKRGIVYVDEENCVGCGLCAKACKFDPSRIVIDKKRKKARKCDLCRTRPEGPMCIEYCPAKCLGLSTDPLPYEISEKGEVIAK